MVDASEPDGVSLAVGEDGFHAVFVTASGDERWVPWRRLPQVVDEIGGPGRGRVAPTKSSLGEHSMSARPAAAAARATHSNPEFATSPEKHQRSNQEPNMANRWSGHQSHDRSLEN